MNTQLSLNQVVDVIVTVGPQAAAYANFQQFLIVGNSPRIANATRLAAFTSLAQMLAAPYSFATTDPEYLAASLYVSAINQAFGSGAAYTLWIGLQDTTAVKTAAIVGAGTLYAQGDLLTLAGGTGCVYVVSSVNGSTGAITGVTQVSAGTGYTVTTPVATSTNSVHGAGATFNVTVLGETPLQAVTACRGASNSWYGCMCVSTGIADGDHEAIAGYLNGASPASFYAYTTAEAAVLNNTGGNLGATLMGSQYNRTIGQYSSTQGGLNTGYPYAIAAIMAYAMGANTGLANSAYTLKFKQEPGVLVEPVTPTQQGNVEGNNVNLYVNYNNQFNWFEQGVMANGQYFDEIVNLDMLGNRIQINVANLLQSLPKIPDDDDGVTLLMNAVRQACDQMRTVGFIAPSGVWNGPNLLNLSNGDAMPKGYVVQAQSVTTLSSAQRSARQAPPIYVNLIEAGAVHFVTVQVNVQR
jgi:hypothetical protein